MNDKQLADRIVALGVGEYRGDGRYLVAPATDQIREHGSAKWFVRDPRVAMALMEKVIAKEDRDINCGHTRRYREKIKAIVDSGVLKDE